MNHNIVNDANVTAEILKLVINDYKKIIHKTINKESTNEESTNKEFGADLKQQLKNAIEAVLNYEKHNYFYFAADASKPGFHKFARSLTEHNRNAREYQRYLSQQGIRR